MCLRRLHLQVRQYLFDRVIACRVRQKDGVVVAVATVHAGSVGPAPACRLVLVGRLPVPLGDFLRADGASWFLPS